MVTIMIMFFFLEHIIIVTLELMINDRMYRTKYNERTNDDYNIDYNSNRSSYS